MRSPSLLKNSECTWPRRGERTVVLVCGSIRNEEREGVRTAAPPVRPLTEHFWWTNGHSFASYPERFRAPMNQLVNKGPDQAMGTHRWSMNQGRAIRRPNMPSGVFLFVEVGELPHVVCSSRVRVNRKASGRWVHTETTRFLVTYAQIGSNDRN